MYCADCVVSMLFFVDDDLAIGLGVGLGFGFVLGMLILFMWFHSRKSNQKQKRAQYAVFSSVMTQRSISADCISILMYYVAMCDRAEEYNQHQQQHLRNLLLQYQHLPRHRNPYQHLLQLLQLLLNLLLHLLLLLQLHRTTSHH